MANLEKANERANNTARENYRLKISSRLPKLPFVKEALMAVFLIGGSGALAKCGVIELTPGQRLNCPYGQTCDGGDAGPDGFDVKDAGDGGDALDAGDVLDGGDIIEPELCENNNDCRDNNKCTTERCEQQNPQADEKGCVFEPVRIDDNVRCTRDSCDPEHGIAHEPNDRLCNDANPCTTDVCTPEGCHYETSVNGTPCDLRPDIDDEQCFEGNCSPPCTRQSGCNDEKSCTSEYCYVNSGRCLYDPRHSRCDDQNVCNGLESCNPNAPDADALTGCAPATETLVCDDNNPCNGQETCDPERGCVEGTPVDCSNLNGDCIEGVCNSASGACEAQPKQNGTQCEDGRSCTVEDSCRDGVCVSGGTINCNDRIPCTIDACSEERQRCIHTPENSRCDNNLFCDGQEICDTARGCIADTVPECLGGNQCNVSSCDENSDACELTPVENGTSCEDGNQCTGEDTCRDGGCVGGPPPAEVPGNLIDENCNGWIDDVEGVQIKCETGASIIPSDQPVHNCESDELISIPYIPSETHTSIAILPTHQDGADRYATFITLAPRNLSPYAHVSARTASSLNPLTVQGVSCPGSLPELPPWARGVCYRSPPPGSLVFENIEFQIRP